MPSFSDLLANNPYDGDPLDGSEVIALLEDDEGLLEGITTSQLFDLLPSTRIVSTEKPMLSLDATGKAYVDKKFWFDVIGNPNRLRFLRSGDGKQLLFLADNGDITAKGILQFRTGASDFNIDPVNTSSTLRFVNPNTGDGMYLDDQGGLDLDGALTAPTKNFLIPHPNPDKSDTHTLRHGSLEGAENGVYQRGTLNGSAVIDLPSYWPDLVDETTITVNLTALGGFQKLYIKSKSADQVEIGIEGANASDLHADYTVYAERKDVAPLVVEEEK